MLCRTHPCHTLAVVVQKRSPRSELSRHYSHAQPADFVVVSPEFATAAERREGWGLESRPPDTPSDGPKWTGMAGGR